MNQHQTLTRNPGGNPAQNYERFFVPAIGAPVARDVVAIAALQPGESVLDVACGTGVVTRLAAERVGAAGSVTGLDIQPGMLAVAASATPPELSIDWREADAQALPFPDETFDVVFCQMGLQFVTDKHEALHEMWRVLKPGGRAIVSVPGPKPPLFAIMADALGRHFGPQPAAFAERVFSLHDAGQLGDLARSAGFRDIDVDAKPVTLRLPAPSDFLWQYLYSTPLAQAATEAGAAKCEALESDIRPQWEQFVVDGSMELQVGATTVRAIK